MMRPFANGPLSLMRTSTDRPVSRLVTSTQVPKGSVRWAAVIWPMSYTSPLAVRRPWCGLPYQDASPDSSWPTATGTDRVRGGVAQAPSAPATNSGHNIQRVRTRLPSMSLFWKGAGSAAQKKLAPEPPFPASSGDVLRQGRAHLDWSY